MTGRPFAKGQDSRRAKGGARANAGRDPDWLRLKCQEIIEKRKILEFLADVADGKDIEQAVGSEGEIISIPAAVRDRIKASEILLERGHGKVPQALEHSGPGGEPLTVKLVKYD